MKEDIDEALFDATCDGEGSVRSRDLVRNLEAQGLKIVRIQEDPLKVTP